MATQQPSVTVTDGTGFFVLPNLPPGRYEVSAELEGFKKAVVTDLPLDASAKISRTFTLEAGGLSETVTVTSEATPMATDVAMRKTVEAKDIEVLSFNGRNPIGVAGLKPGVLGGSFNSCGFSSLSNGGYNINGSRSDENNITVDGATAIRTRSAGTIIGVQNVEAVQEVQVLTANYMPEFGRASGGQIRFVTKSGSNRYTGSGSFFFRDESLQANTWARNRSSNAAENSGPAPFDQKQYGYSFGGPFPGMRDKLFFFGAQEWVNFFQEATTVITVPTALMRAGDFSELLSPTNGFFSGARDHHRPADRPALPRQHHPGEQAVAEWPGDPERVPGAHARVPPGHGERDHQQPEPAGPVEEQHPARLPDERQQRVRLPLHAVELGGGGRLPRRHHVRPHRLGTSQLDLDGELDEHAHQHAGQRVHLHVFEGRREDQRLHRGRGYQRSKYRINYPYVYPGEGDLRQGADRVDGALHRRSTAARTRRSRRARSTPGRTTTTWVKGRHTLKAGIAVEYSGRGRLRPDQRQRHPGRHQQPERPVRVPGRPRPAGSGLAMANAALGLFSNYAELGERNYTEWRSLATDIFVQDSWKPNAKMTIEGGFRYVIWPPWYSNTNNIANFDPRFYNKASEAVINPSTGRIVSGPRYNGIVLPGDGFEGDGKNSSIANDPAVLALFRGEPRGFSDTHYNVLEPRGGMSYAMNEKTIFKMSGGIFHNRVTLNDSTLLGGKPPFQPMVTISNGSVDNPGGGRAPLGYRSPTPRRTSRSSTRRPTCGRPPSSARSPGASPWKPPTSDAAASTCSASATSTSWKCPGRSRPTPASTSRHCVPTRATAPSDCPRTPATPSTTASS